MMTIDERHLLRRLREIIARVPTNAPTDDWVTVMNTNQNVLALVLSAQEPMNKPAKQYKRAAEVLDRLDHFVNQLTNTTRQPAERSRN